ncbi:MAG: right-handed parallel beta-helix repeat-containing protein, partial [Anaerolineales bacterium]|nr:right-handed parallel beta-helix repeat-containing protein [Anaerolineales bacterium]
PPAYVYPNQDACNKDLCQPPGQAQGLVWGTTAFDNIQAAIDTGARTVHIMPGRYPQDFYLVSGLTIFGAGADKTLIEPPSGTPQTLVTAEGTAANKFGLVTLLDDNNEWNGLSVEGTLNFLVTRLIGRGTNTAVRVDGALTKAEISNLTLVGNTNGIQATNCAELDLRNTIFASHTDTALSYDENACNATQKHQYNLYWANGNDFKIDGAVRQEPGLGELFTNPVFINPAQFDYRLYEQSPAIDRGNPGDPVPPGTNGRIDIGYVENGQASFYADDDYCETCLNDGLIWGVTAFSKIQDALDAAGQSVRTLYTTAPPSERFTVGVGAGNYRENLTLPSYVRLFGTSADEVIVDGGGTGNTAVVNGTTQIEIRGLTFRNAAQAGLAIQNGAQKITIYRVISRDNQTGLAVSGAANADLYHLTVVDNSGAGISSNGQNSRTSLINSIVANNATGLQSDGTAVLVSDYNILNNTTNTQNVTVGRNDQQGVDPQFNNPASDDFTLKLTSPAVDSGSPTFPTLIGGGKASDRGYDELQSIPIPVFLGREGISAAVGNAGVKSVEVGIVQITNPNQPVTATLPTSWNPASVNTAGQTGSYWTYNFTPQAEGLYRIYSRATDRLDNAETTQTDWFEGQFVVDTAVPTVSITSPGNTSTTEAAIKVSGTASDYLTSGGTTFFSVAQVYFEANGTTYPARWVDNGWTSGSGQPRPFEAWIPLPNDGAQTITAVAVDFAGQEARQDMTANVSTPANVVTIIFPEGSQATNQNPLTMQGFARYTTAAGGGVNVQIDSDPAVAANLAAPNSRFSFWSATAPVTG